MIPKELYKNLKPSDKLNIIRYERGHHSLLNIDFYAEIKNNPRKSVCPTRLYISNVLDLDFDTDVYDNGEVLSNCKKHSEVLSKKTGDWFIGDALTNKLWKLILKYPEGDPQLKIDKELKRLYKLYLDIVSEENLPKDLYFYVDSGITINGEQLYKKVRLTTGTNL